MRILMLSLDKTLLGEQAWALYGRQGDTIERHRQYGDLVDKLNIMVTSPSGYEHVNLSEKVDIYPTNASSPRNHQKAVYSFAQAMKRHGGLDLVVAQDLTAPAAAKIKKLLGVPFVVTFHGADFNSPEWQGSLKKKIILKLVKRAVKQADGLRVVSPAMEKYFTALGVNCPIEVIPTPSDISIFSQAADLTSTRMQSFPEHKKLLAVGRLEPVKNYPLLFEVLALVKEKIENIKLFIIGTGSQEAKLQELVKQKKLSHNVVFLGSMPYDQLPPYFQAADAFILSSDSESLGKVLIQAGAASTPVVATRTLGAKSIILNGKTGYLVDVGDALELSDKIIKLLEDEALGKKLGQAAQKHILDNYNAQENIQRFIKFWQKIVNNFNSVTLERQR